jgi:hypothetical protein
MFSFEFQLGTTEWDDIADLLGPECIVEFHSKKKGVVKSNDEKCLGGSRKRFMQKGISVGTITDLEPKIEEEPEVEEIEEEEFASTASALQYLADITGKSVKIASVVEDTRLDTKASRLDMLSKACDDIDSVLSFYAVPKGTVGIKFMKLLNAYRAMNLKNEATKLINKATY